ncbi:MAG: type IV secretory system conjugative DNA transfer family protein, partial [Lachnospiraceae bacterium]|nr:type IV secretory system conjugative DNA transfer family protein [Lachnospiraceae bacterium]
MTKKRILLYSAVYGLFFCCLLLVVAGYRASPGTGIGEKILTIREGIRMAIRHPLAMLKTTEVMIAVLGTGMLFLAVRINHQNQKKFRKGEEYGSARWGNRRDIASFMDPDPAKNVILTKTEGLTMDSRPKDPKYARNKNVLIIGGSGSGKTRFYVTPNIMQLHSSYVITDPKGTIIENVGTLLLAAGYKVKVLNTVNFSKSMHYNPFSYIHSEKDILKFVNVIMANTKGEGEKSGEDFWVKAERLLYCALIGYIWYEAPEREQNFSMLLDLINASQAKDEDEDFQSPVDILFNRLKSWDPEHFAVRQYTKFKLAAGKTLKSILVSCGARLAPFDIKELRDLTEYDELSIDMIGERKTALFLIMSDTDTT